MCLCLPLWCCAQANRWEALYVFGDSYSDSQDMWIETAQPRLFTWRQTSAFRSLTRENRLRPVDARSTGKCDFKSMI